ncbi:MAG: AMP-binding protein [Firmicutes bacterium]|nr:AMP-binding protein [Bacillota bacterium]
MSYIEIPQLKPLYPSVYHKDFRDMLNNIAARYNDETAFILKHKNKGEVSYENISFKAFRDDAFAIGTAMLKKGWHGKRIAVVGPNSYNWMATFFATLGGVGITVPLDRGLPYEELESSLARSYADVLVFDKTSHKEMVERLKAEGKTLVKEYISMTELEGYETLDDLREQGKAALAEGYDEYSTVAIDEHATTILLFTSGTTSMSKAVMLSQQNILSNVKAMEATEKFIKGDVNMAFLPYHHTFGSVGQTLMLACGVATAYCDGLKYLQKNLVEYKVSVFFCVPLLIESIYKKVMQGVKKQGKEKTLATGIKISQFLLKFGIDIRRKLFKDILDQLGGNLRFVISGAAAIDPEAIKGFNNIGISAVQGFGMTEASPVITAENDKERSLGSCGHAMLGVEVRIDNPDENGVGEVIARGPNIMAGYYENEEETSKTLVDGWLHTGDLAYADKNGYLFICGRKKNVIVLKNGKNVYPEEIEVMISNLEYVEECMVFGQPRRADDPVDLAVCLKVVYKADVMKDTYGATTLEEIEKVVRADVDKINDTMPLFKQITKIIVTDEPMIKTTTGKVKRYEETKNL